VAIMRQSGHYALAKGERVEAGPSDEL